MLTRLLPLILLILGLVLVVAGICGLVGIWWALVAAGVGCVALAVNEAT